MVLAVPKLPQPSQMAEHFPARYEFEYHVQVAIVLFFEENKIEYNMLGVGDSSWMNIIVKGNSDKAIFFARFQRFCQSWPTHIFPIHKTRGGFGSFIFFAWHRADVSLGGWRRNFDRTRQFYVYIYIFICLEKTAEGNLYKICVHIFFNKPFKSILSQ